MNNALEIHAESANLSEEQFFQLCAQNKEINFERNEHKNIIIMSPVGFLSSWYERIILRILDQWNEQTKSGYVTGSSGGYILPDGAMRAPDAAWTKKERIDALPLSEKERFPHLCPDFVIELKSKSDSLKTLKKKMDEWIKNGCHLAFLIIPEEKIAIVYRNNGTTEEKTFAQKLSGEDVLPGFELDLQELR